MKCYIDQIAAQKLHYYVQSVDAEISGIGRSEIINGDIYIRDVRIRKQKCSGARTTIDEMDDAKEAYEMVKAGEDLNKWNIWWHSHNTMGVFWSGTDTNTIKEHANNGGFLISLVTNKKGEYRVRVDVFPKDISPFSIVTHAMAQDNIDVEILPTNVDEDRKKTLEEFLTEKTNEIDEAIKIVEEDFNAQISALVQQKKETVKAYEDSYYESYGDLEDEFKQLSGGEVFENIPLKSQIEEEVKEKVEIETFQYKKHGAYKVHGYDQYEDDYLPSHSNKHKGGALTKEYIESLWNKDKLTKEEDKLLDDYVYNSYGQDDDANDYPIGFRESQKEDEEDEIREWNKSFIPEVGIS